jgi:hypothetical protein
MAKRRDQSKHDSMVKSVADHVSNNGHTNVKADIKGYDRPDLLYWESTKKGHIPDVTSTEVTKYLFEVETDDSIDDSHTEDQWKLFSANAQQHSKKFIVVVPKGSEQQAWSRAKGLGVTLHDVWTVG